MNILTKRESVASVPGLVDYHVKVEYPCCAGRRGQNRKVRLRIRDQKLTVFTRKCPGCGTRWSVEVKPADTVDRGYQLDRVIWTKVSDPPWVIRPTGSLWPKERLCVAREPLLYGSRPCPKPRHGNWDLCETHGNQIQPHQLIDGTLYIGDLADGD